MIKTFAINQIGSLSQIFKGKLKKEDVQSIIETLVTYAYFTNDAGA